MVSKQNINGLLYINTYVYAYIYSTYIQEIHIERDINTHMYLSYLSQFHTRAQWMKAPYTAAAAHLRKQPNAAA